MKPGVLMMKKSQIAVLVLIVFFAGAGFAFYKSMPLSLYKYLLSMSVAKPATMSA